jgi:3-isopropylmalate/(R)-2-methylmalate dehydratase small subunit
MDPVTTITGAVAVIDRPDIDTDQVIPKQFLKRIERTGWGEFLFWDWRLDEDGNPRPDFELNNPAFADADVLIVGRNFGCGSSREHAPWALQGYGFKAVIAPSFADIFRSNCMKVGLVPIELPEEAVRALMDAVDAENGSQITVDLEAQTITSPDGSAIAFEFDSFRRHCLLNGLDDIALTLQHEADIAAYEAANPSRIDTLALTRK